MDSVNVPTYDRTTELLLEIAWKSRRMQDCSDALRDYMLSWMGAQFLDFMFPFEALLRMGYEVETAKKMLVDEDLEETIEE